MVNFGGEDESNFEQKFLTEKRNAIVENLLGKFTCELPART
jgi:hypothetical protein